jgi:hypothetical protein
MDCHLPARLIVLVPSLWGVLALTSIGCTVPRNLTLTNFRKEYPGTKADSIEITTRALLKPPSLEVGYMYVEENSLEKATMTARRQAAEAGGTMIVDARVGVRIRNVGYFLFFPLFDRMYFVKGVVVRRGSPEK